MLYLPDVALICVDTVCPELAALAIRESCSKVKFGSVHVWSNNQDGFWGCFPNQEHVHLRTCQAASFTDVAQITWEVVPEKVKQKFVLVQHWDSWILDPDMWEDTYLAHDYIGAPWGWHHDGNQVGNGGFSLRSMRLINKVAEHKLWKYWGQPEDVTVCRINYGVLKGDFSFAPVPLAAKFAFERTHYKGPNEHFGFHGVFNFRKVMKPKDFDSRMQLVLANDYLKNKAAVQEVIDLTQNGQTT